jgi:DNA-binding CsgD family transcriptional regulator
MNLWNWLRRIFHRKGKAPPRVSMETYEQTIDIQQQAITNLIHIIAEHEQRSHQDVENEMLLRAVEEYAHLEEKWAKWNSLSRREQQATALSCLGYPNEYIAQKLLISPNTVKTHIRNVQRKFDVQNKEQMRELFKGWDFRAFDD